MPNEATQATGETPNYTEQLFGLKSGDLLSYLSLQAGAFGEDGVVNTTPLGGGLMKVECHLERMEGLSELGFNRGDGIPIAVGSSMSVIRDDVPYCVLENANPEDLFSSSTLWAMDPNALSSENPEEWDVYRVGLVAPDGTDAEEGHYSIVDVLADGTMMQRSLQDFGIDPSQLYTFHNKAENVFLRFGDLAAGMFFLLMQVELAKRVSRRSQDDADGSDDKPYVRRKPTNVRVKHLDLMNGTITNAIFERGRSGIGPAAYFSDDPTSLSAGNGGEVLVTVAAPDGTNIDAPADTYQPSDRTRFWLDPLYTLAYEGHDEITGSDLLKQNGISNPYSATSQGAMRDALENILRATLTVVSIDVTNEKRKTRRGNAVVSGSVRLKPLVSADIDLDTLTTDDGDIVRDFTVRLKYRGGDVGEALPVAQYERSRGMFTQVSASDVTFTGIRLTTDDRQMWRYVLRRIKARKQSDTILFETMWRDLEIQDPEVSAYLNPNAVDADGNRTDDELADEKTMERRKADALRKKRDRMTTTLYRMLDQKKGILFASYQRKRVGGKVVGITVKPLEK